MSNLINLWGDDVFKDAIRGFSLKLNGGNQWGGLEDRIRQKLAMYGITEAKLTIELRSPEGSDIRLSIEDLY